MKAISVLICFVSINLCAQNTFLKITYPNIKEDYEIGPPPVFELSDGGTLVTNNIIKSDSFFNIRLQIVRNDKFGNILWIKIFKTDISLVFAFNEDKNGDLYFIGSNGFGSFAFKTNAQGELIWSKRYGASLSSFNRAHKMSDGQLILCGETSIDDSPGTGVDLGAFIVSIDLNGNINWQKSFGHIGKKGQGEASFYDVFETDDGNIIASGERNTTIPYDHGTFIVEMNKQGHKLWDKQYDNLENFPANPVNMTQGIGGGYLFVQIINSPKSNNYLVKINNKGEIEWNKRYNYSEETFLFYVPLKLLSNDSYQIISTSLSDKVFLLNIDNNGKILKCNYFHGNSALVPDDAILSKDGSILLSGRGSGGVGSENVEEYQYLIKTDKNGELECNSVEVDKNKFTISDFNIKVDSNFLDEYVNFPVDDIIIEEDYFEIIQKTICETNATQEPKSTKATLKLFPNPVTNELNITIDKTTLPTVAKLSIDIVDGLGRTLLSQKLDWDGQAIINTSELPPGWYAAVVNGDGHKLLAEKFVVMRFN